MSYSSRLWDMLSVRTLNVASSGHPMVGGPGETFCSRTIRPVESTSYSIHTIPTSFFQRFGRHAGNPGISPAADPEADCTDRLMAAKPGNASKETGYRMGSLG